jgi:hypothetical protein
MATLTKEILSERSTSTDVSSLASPKDDQVTKFLQNIDELL